MNNKPICFPESDPEPFYTTLPLGYERWSHALADARLSPAWNNADHSIRFFRRNTSRTDPDHYVRYEKAYMVSQAAMEAESGGEPEGGQIVESMAG